MDVMTGIPQTDYQALAFFFMYVSGVQALMIVGLLLALKLMTSLRK